MTALDTVVLLLVVMDLDVLNSVLRPQSHGQNSPKSIPCPPKFEVFNLGTKWIYIFWPFPEAFFSLVEEEMEMK